MTGPQLKEDRMKDKRENGSDRDDYLALCARMRDLARKHPTVDWMSLYLEGGTVRQTNARLDRELKLRHLA